MKEGVDSYCSLKCTNLAGASNLHLHSKWLVISFIIYIDWCLLLYLVVLRALGISYMLHYNIMLLGKWVVK